MHVYTDPTQWSLVAGMYKVAAIGLEGVIGTKGHPKNI